MTPLERAARALFWSRGGGNWLQANQVEKDGWIKSARSGIEEIREPSLEMKLSGAPKITAQMPRIGIQADYDAADDSWKAMIDALLDLASRQI